MTYPRWDRWGPLTGLLAVAFMVAAFLVAGSTPDTGDSNAKIVSYFEKSSNQHKQIAGFFLFLAGVLLLLAFVAALRQRLSAAEGEPGRMGTLALAGGVASAVFWLTAIVLFVSPAL